MNKDELKNFAIVLMDDEHGINEQAWRLLEPQLVAAGNCQDILDAVDASGSRYFLPEDFQAATMV